MDDDDSFRAPADDPNDESVDIDDQEDSDDDYYR